MSDNEPSESKKSEIRSLVDRYLSEHASGQQPSIEPVVDQHAHLMPELASELRKAALIARARKRTHHTTIAHSQTHADVEQGKPSGLTVRCPNCRSPVEIFVDTPWTEISCTECGSPFSLVADDLATHNAISLKTIGHFELIERIGVGGFGSVWKARDTVLERTVALKIPREGQLTEVDKKRFLREATAAAQLNHPNIVRIYEVGRDDETVFIVSDLIRGLTLSDWISVSQPNFKESVRICRDIAAGLEHAHQASIIHRDLKPANVLIDEHNRPHIMDFGLAKREAPEITVTADGQVIGTPAYMSPEQARGEGNKSDARTDIYSLGVILYELLTGEIPFRGSTRMLLQQVIIEEPPAPRKLNSMVPRDLENVCLKCMEKEPVKRYGSAKEVAEELNRYLDGLPVKARPVGSIGRAYRWCCRKPVIAGLAAISLLAVLGGAAISTHFYRQAQREQFHVKESEIKNLKLESQAKHAEAKMLRDRLAAQPLEQMLANKSNKRRLFNARLRMVDQIRERDPAQALRLLEDTAHCAVDLRNFVWRFLWEQCSQVQVRVATDHNFPIQHVAVFDELAIGITIDQHQHAIARDLKNWRPLWESKFTDFEIASTGVDPSGKHLWLATNLGIRSLDAKTGEALEQLETAGPVVAIATSTADGEINGDTPEPNGVNFRASSPRIAWVESSENKFSVQMAPIDAMHDQQQHETLSESSKDKTSLAFSATQRYVAWIEGRQLKIWDTANSQFVNLSTKSPVSRMMFCDDAPNSIVVFDENRKLTAYRLESRTQIWQRSVTLGSSFCGAGGKSLIIGGNPLTTLNANSGEVTLKLNVPLAPVRMAAISEKHRAIFAAGPHGLTYGCRLPGEIRATPWSGVHPDGNSVTSGNGELSANWYGDTNIIVKNVMDDRTKHRLDHHGDNLRATFSRNARWLAIGNDFKVYVYETRYGKCVDVIEHDATLSAFAISELGETVISADESGKILIWTEAGKPQVINAGPNSATANTKKNAKPIAISNNKATITSLGLLEYEDEDRDIVAGYSDGRLAILRKDNRQFWQAVTPSEAHSHPVERIVVSKSKDQINYQHKMIVLSIDASGAKKLWDATRKYESVDGQMNSLTIGSQQKVKAESLAGIADLTLVRDLTSTGLHAEFSRDGNTLALVDDESVSFYDGWTGEFQAKVKAVDSPIRNIAFVSHLKFMVRSARNRQVYLEARHLGQARRNFGGPVRHIVGAKIDGSESELTIGVDAEGILQATTPQDLQSSTRILFEQGGVACTSQSLDRRRIVLGHWNGDITMIQDRSSDCKSWHAHHGYVRSVSMSNELVASCSLDGQMKIWKLDSSGLTGNSFGDPSTMIDLGEHPPSQVSFTASGKFLAAVSADGLRYWNVASETTPELVRHDASQRADQIARHPKLDQLAMCSREGQLTLFSITDQKIVSTQHLDGFARCLGFSPSGDQIAVGLDDGKVTVYNVPGLVDVAHFEGHHGAINTLIFRPDGNSLVTGADDGMTRQFALRKSPSTGPPLDLLQQFRNRPQPN